MKVYLITNNKGKLLAAQKAFKGSEIKLEQLKGDYPEIQAGNSLDIARYTAVQVAKEKNLPVIREDHSFFINALGIPGPYMKFVEERIPAEDLLKMLSNFEDRTGYFELSLVYAEPNGLTKEYTYKVPIVLSEELKGTRGNWNKILMLKDRDKTFAQTDEEENVNTWNKNFKKIREYLEENY